MANMLPNVGYSLEDTPGKRRRSCTAFRRKKNTNWVTRAMSMAMAMAMAMDKFAEGHLTPYVIPLSTYYLPYVTIHPAIADRSEGWRAVQRPIRDSY